MSIGYAREYDLETDAASMLEQAAWRVTRTAARNRGGLAQRTKGIPDLYIRHPKIGVPSAWIELKRDEKGTVSDEQRDWIRSEIICGGHAYVACSLDEVAAISTKLGIPIELEAA